MTTTTPPAPPANPVPSGDDPKPEPTSRLTDQQRAFKRYKQAVGESGKPFFPYGVYHDIIAAIVVLLIIIGLSVVWFAQANCDSWWNTSCGTVATPQEQQQYHPGHPTQVDMAIDSDTGKPAPVEVGHQSGPSGNGPVEKGPLLGPLYEDQADPATASYKPRPEWYFYFLFYLLILFHYPNLVVVGTIGLPTLFLVALIAWPFIDRKKERRPSRRPIAMSAMALTAVVLMSFTYLGAIHDRTSGPKGISAAQQKLPGFDILFNGPAKSACIACHVLGGSGGNVGPSLDAEGTVSGHDLTWEIKHLSNPSSETPGSAMPARGGVQLSPLQVAQVAAFLTTLGAPDKASDPAVTGASAATVAAALGTGSSSGGAAAGGGSTTASSTAATPTTSSSMTATTATAMASIPSSTTPSTTSH
jgi:ubiquinol-cytochrome c reductase cytochrome b subunit/menaquinol-cytochrome c reductase cytochrome b/c subunit